MDQPRPDWITNFICERTRGDANTPVEGTLPQFGDEYLNHKVRVLWWI